MIVHRVEAKTQQQSWSNDLEPLEIAVFGALILVVVGVRLAIGRVRCPRRAKDIGESVHNAEKGGVAGTYRGY